jgi:Protein of unknown function (DUF3429)
MLCSWVGLGSSRLLYRRQGLSSRSTRWSLDLTVALRAYGACILSFMGGAQWGVLLPRAEGYAPFFRYLISVLPALLAFLCLLIPDTLGLIGLIVSFSILLVYDLSTVRQGLASRWYASFRIQLTLAVVVRHRQVNELRS